MLGREQVDEIAQRLAAASKGPFKAEILGCGKTIVCAIKDLRGKVIVQWNGFDSSGTSRIKQAANCEMLANAPTDIAVLLADREAMLKEIEGLREALRPFAEANYCYDSNERDGCFAEFDENIFRLKDMRKAREALKYDEPGGVMTVNPRLLEEIEVVVAKENQGTVAPGE